MINAEMEQIAWICASTKLPDGQGGFYWIEG